MKNKINLLFALLYFACIFIGYTSNFFDPLFDNIYYGHLVYLFNRIVRIIIYLVLAIVLGIIYKKHFDNHQGEKQKLTTKKTIVLYSLTFLVITIVSIVAGWQLKPLSDLGEKYTLIQIYDKLGDLGVLALDIYFMTCMLKHFDNYYVSNFKDFKNFSVSIIFILLTYSIYSLITSFDIYQLILVPFTVLLGFIYPYTSKSFWKTYLIAVLVFLF